MSKLSANALRLRLVSMLLISFAIAANACAAPTQGGALPQPLPLLSADNWWNTDISSAPVDSSSASFISFINNGSTRHLHPDFGGDVSTGSVDIYGFPYITVDSSQPKLPVQFLYSDESDGVNHSTDASYAFYPIPTQAITQAHWVEGGAAGNVDQRADGDRHLLILDRDNKLLYELYNVWYDGSQWQAGSGALFDLKTNNRRPEGWTSADAAGLAILPGLVRYDEVYNVYGTSISDINHAFRVTVRSSNGHVYPASHTAGSKFGALPMGARLRLKASKNISGFTPEMQKIFRAMKKYGLIVADNGSDMYISGSYDTHWDNDVLNPAFGALSASDFEVVQLGWKPPPPSVSLTSVAVTPTSVVGGNSASGTVTLSSAAPTGGISIAMTASGPISVPASVGVPAGATSVMFAIATQGVATTTSATLTASDSGTSKSASLTLAAAQLSTLNINPGTLPAGGSATGSVVLNGQAPPTGALVILSSSNKGAATVPENVTIAAGDSSAAFNIVAKSVRRTQSTIISATYSGVTRILRLKVRSASLLPPPNPY